MSTMAPRLPTREKQRYCKRGHDTFVTGRYKTNTCIRCRREYDRRAAAARTHGMTSFARSHNCECEPCQEAILATEVRQQMLPFEPLLPFKPQMFSRFDVSNHSGGLAAWPERLQQAWFRGRQAGRISVMQADEICLQIGKHPLDIFGPAWFEDVSA